MAPETARWTCTPYSVDAAERLARALGVAPAVATVLVRRGYATPEAASEFLEAGERHDPRAFAGMDAACDVILGHVRRGSSIVVHGDYDVDGVCSTAIVLGVLRRLGADPRWHIPAREDGYGLSTATVERLAASGAGLIVTTDCAVGAVEEIARARALGVDVVVTDHHRPGEVLPDCPIVHPAVSGYPFADLCAAGVAHKLTEALLARAGMDPALADADLDLVALATVADVVSLTGENRRLVRDGLRVMARTERAGLRALMSVAQVDPGAMSEHALGFRLGPRINAAGRLAHAEAALELLLTGDDRRGEEIARELDELNRRRQDTETRILFGAEAARSEHPDGRAYVLAGEGWHPGVIGIVASRMVERYHRPCVMIAIDERDGSGKGSGRSISAFDLHGALGACSGHLRRFGGHRAAAGLEIDAERVDAFRDAFVAHAAGVLTDEDLVRVERIDAVVGADAVGTDLAEELERLGPFGHGNPQPTLLVPATKVSEVRGMGEDDQHARLTIASGGGARARAVAFRTTPGSLKADPDARFDAAVKLELNEWNGTVEPRLVLRSLCPTQRGDCRPVGAELPFWEAFQAELGESGGSGPPGGVHSTAAGEGEARLGSATPSGSVPTPGGSAPLSGSASPSGSATPSSTARPQPAPGGFAERPATALAPARTLRDRRGEGFAGIAGDLLSSGEPVAIVCADVERRRHGLEEVVAGIAGAVGGECAECPALVSWEGLAADPAVAREFTHLIALDPPASPAERDLLVAAPSPPGGFAHLAWSAAEAEFALGIARRDLDLRPTVAAVYRELRDASPCAGRQLEELLRGPRARPPVLAARAVRVLVELGLVAFEPAAAGGYSARVLDAGRTELERSPTFRACSERLAAATAYISGEAAQAQSRAA
ncbi:MAG TPA: single-stranded-DNA-specific exonuclease RecJ [Thermoleophilaceae bacterium]